MSRILLKSDMTYLLLPVMGWLLFLMLANPFRRAVLDDDFATVWEVKHYLEAGYYKPHHWTAPFTYPQVLYGMKFVQFFEDYLSIEGSLRLSTLILSLAG